MVSSEAAALKLSYQVPLARLSTWKIGGPLDVLAEPCGVEQSLRALEMAKKEGLPVLFLGNGSNLLFDDEGFRGMAIKPLGTASSFEVISNELIVAPAGRLLAALARFARRAGSEALDWMATVPGCVGGSVVNNAGAFGREMADHLEWIEGIDLKDLSLRQIHRRDLNFGYRKSELRGNFLVLRAAFRMEKIPLGGFSEFARRRKATQPLARPSCGCVFKNPDGDSAGRLIELCGLKGLRRGDAEVSDLHANFILNAGKATSVQVEELIRMVQSSVQERAGIILEREVQFLREVIVRAA